MNLILDPVTEKRIQDEVELGHYGGASEVVARAVALLGDAEQSQPRVSPEDTKAAIDGVFGLWADREEDGVAYQERLRSEW